MRRSIRPAKRTKTLTPVEFSGRTFLVPRIGKVLDAKTKRPVSTRDADKARHLLRQLIMHDAAGQPPRRGPADLLRSAMKFSVDLNSYTVSVGPTVFAKQPK